jgi:aspartate beta-hydroxylase
VVVDVAALVQTGIAALRAGDAKGAREAFERIVAAGKADASIWHALAVACQRQGDVQAMLMAADKVLEVDRAHIPCLIMKGDYYAEIGDERAALSFYEVVVAFAERMANQPPEMVAAMGRASAARDRYRAKMMSHVAASLDAAGYHRGQSSARFTHAVDLLSGAKRRYDQEPRAFFFPELPPIQFYPRSQFGWMDSVESATDDICRELDEVMKDDAQFVPYIQRDPNRPIADHLNLMDRRDWTAFFLWKDGAPVKDHAERCPKTMAALENAPLTRIKGRSPSILFSRLLPGAKIPPHNGFINARLICHLPLIVPKGCRFRVGNDEREWEKGKAWVFDDTIEHEASNPTEQTRVVLIFEVWRPELTRDERDLVAALIAAVDTYQGDARVRWDD